MSRAVSRLRLVVPEAPSSLLERGTARVPESVDMLARALGDALATVGIVARQQLHSGAADGAPRGDVAIWFPAVDGATIAPDTRLAPARAHVAIVVDPGSAPRHLARYDALFVPLASQVAPVREALIKSGRKPPVHHVRLCGTGPTRDAEKAERGVAGRVVVLDLRRGSACGADLERSILQLALRSENATLVLVVDDDGDASDRVRHLAQRHGVAAWLASGPDAMASAIVSADLVIGTLRWDETLLAASARVAVMATPAADGRGQALLSALRDAAVVEELPGTLQLAAAIDRRLKDDAGLATRGLSLHEALLQSPRGLYDALVDVGPLPGTQASVSRWEPVGVLATPAQPVAPIEPTQPTISTAQRIEDDLAALKARLANEGGDR